jgi:adenylate kinase
MKAGELVPDAMILSLILSELRSKNWLTTTEDIPSLVSSSLSATPSKPLSTSASFILDGFPRTAHQATLLDRLIPINLVVHLLTPSSIILDRIAKRWVHAPSGRVYNTHFNAPKVAGKDDVTGEALTKREDDDEETWRNRLRKFEETSLPLLEHYERLGVLWRVEGNSSDEISPKLFGEVERRFS